MRNPNVRHFTNMSELSFSLTSEFIELYKLLKLMGLTENGGQAKYAISESKVLVNGAVETRKAFKVRSGHKIEFDGQTILVK